MIFCGILAGSCSKENSNEFIPYPGNELNDTNWNQVPASTAPVRKIHTLFQKPLMFDSINASTGGTLMFNDSIMISFPANFCTNNAGTYVNDKVRIEVVQLARKGDMIRQHKPTMSYQYPLVSGGSIFIKATSNGEELKITPGTKIYVAIANDFTNGSSSGILKVFYGNESANVTSTQNFTWEPSQDSNANVTSTVIQNATGFVPANGFFITRFRWVNCDYFYDTTQPKTKITVSTAPNFTNTNTVVYAVFKNDNIVVYLYDDAAKKIFFMNNAIIGKQVTLVSLSMINDQLYLGSKDITIANNMNVEIQPAKVTKHQIEAFLESL
jgi:hypothetical protein